MKVTHRQKCLIFFFFWFFKEIRIEKHTLLTFDMEIWGKVFKNNQSYAQIHATGNTWIVNHPWLEHFFLFGSKSENIAKVTGGEGHKNILIINHLGVTLSLEIFLKSWLTNVNDVFLRITTLGRVFKIHDIFGTIFDRFIKIFHALGIIARLRGSRGLRRCRRQSCWGAPPASPRSGICK